MISPDPLRDVYKECLFAERVDLVAYLWATTNRDGDYVFSKQLDLANKLGISVSLLSKHLKEARQANLVRESREYLGKQRERFGARLGEEPPLLDHLRALAGQVPHVLQSFRVVTAATGPGSQGNVALGVGRGSAHAVASLLRGVGVIGVTYGMTVHGLASELADRRLLTQRVANVIPLVPEPLGLPFSSLELSSSVIAERLRVAIAEEGAQAHSLLGIPCSLSEYFVEDSRQGARQTIKRWIRGTKAYLDIFHESTGLINQLDAIITSVGILRKNPEHPFHRIIDRALMKESQAIGDVGGVLLTRGDDRAEERYEKLWLGARRQTYIAVANRAAQRADQQGGVIVVAAGAEKADPVMEVARRGWVNHLLVDTSLANALGDRLLRTSSQRR